MQAYAQYLPDKMKEKEKDVCLWCLLLQNSSYFCTIYFACNISFPTIASRRIPRH
jgi:hypothetical protein